MHNKNVFMAIDHKCHPELHVLVITGVISIV